VLEGTQVHVVLRPPDSAARLRGSAIVKEAPPRPVRPNRYELRLAFPAPLESFTPKAGSDFDSGEYRVDANVREVSQGIDVRAIRSEVAAMQGGAGPAGLGSAAPGGRAPTDMPFRARTGALLQPDPEFIGRMLAHVRYRRPDTFVHAWRTQLSGDLVFLEAANPVPVGTRVRLVFLMPRQPTAYRAMGQVIDEPAPAEAAGSGELWVKLDKLPAETRGAFQTAVTMFAPEQAAPKPSRSIWRYLRRA